MTNEQILLAILVGVIGNLLTNPIRWLLAWFFERGVRQKKILSRKQMQKRLAKLVRDRSYIEGLAGDRSLASDLLPGYL